MAAFNATVWVEDGWIKLRWPYNKARMNPLRIELKEVIPYQNRKFDDEAKCWLVDPAYDEILMDLLQRHCDEVSVLGDTTHQAEHVPQQLQGDAASILIGLCPDKTLPKVWRAIAAALHPDAPGGDSEAFVKATQAWDALRVSRGI
jgi:hypothetical protein